MSEEASLTVTLPSLPKGGGAIQSIGHRLGTVGSSGAATCEIALPVSAGRGYAPTLTLGYSSAQGNGPFGLGWTLSLSIIARRTSLGVPAYTDDDLFVGPDGQVWMPERDRISGAIESSQKMCSNGTEQVPHTVVRYRPRVEAAFDRIEHWSSAHDTPGFWLIYSADGSQHVYGKTPLARRAPPTAPSHVAEWLLEESMNAHGEHIVYEYTADEAFTPGMADPRGQRYLSRVRYGNFTADSQLYQCKVDGLKEANWHFELCFDYGERSTALEGKPAYRASLSATVRHDPFSDFSYGFELHTRRLCQQVLMFHYFPDETPMGNNPVLVRRTLLEYQTSRLSYSLLGAVFNQACGVNGEIEHQPPVEFTYSDFVIDPDAVRYKPFHALSGFNRPQRFQFVDLLGEGLPGVLQQTDKSWRYSAPCRDARGADQVTYLEARELPQIPLADSRKPTRQFLGDHNGDGRPDWLVVQPGLSGCFTLAPDGEWSGFAPFAAFPTEFFHGPGQLANLMGAGLSDLAMIGPRSVRLYANRKSAGFAPAIEVSRQTDEDDLPCPGNAPGELVAFSDLLGSGQQHLIRIRHNEVKCWPNLGRGRFGKGRVIATLDFPYDSFDASRILLADLDGSGAADLIYLQADCARIFMNRCGNSLNAAIEVPWPEGLRHDRFCQVIATDLQGSGCSSLVFSAPGRDQRHWRYDFVETKPYLLTGTHNNMGATGSVSYRSSAQEWLDEKQHLLKNKKTAISRLPLALPLVKQQTQYDEITGNRMTQQFKYRRGFYDGVEREFRGFGQLVQTDSLAGHGHPQSGPSTPPTLTKTWFHTGNEVDPPIHDSDRSDKNAVALKTTLQNLGESWSPGTPKRDPAKVFLLTRRREIARALQGRTLRVEVYGRDRAPQSTLPYSVQQHRYQVNELKGRGKHSPYSIVQPVILESISYVYERIPDDPRCTHTIHLNRDAYGHLTHSVEISYARRKTAVDASPFTDTWQQKWWADAHDDEQQYYYLQESKAQFIHIDTPQSRCLGLRYLQRTNALKLPKAPLADGLQPAAIHYENLLVLSASQNWKTRLAMTGLSLARYRKPDASGIFPDGQASVEALVDHLEIAELNDVAMNAYAVLKPPSGQPGFEITQHLQNNGYRKMPMALPSDGSWDEQGNLWSVKRSFSTYKNLDGFFRAQTFKASQQHGTTSIAYDPYYCLVTTVVSPDNCTTRMTAADYRTLQPEKLTDPNGNVREALYDAFGQVLALSHHNPNEKTGFQPIATFTRRYDDRPELAIENPQRALQHIASTYFYEPLNWMGHIPATTATQQNWRKQAVAAGDLLPGGHIRTSARIRLANLHAKTPYQEQLMTFINNAQRQPVRCITMQADRFHTDAEQQIRITVACQDGFGRPLQSKQKVEPGMALAVNEDGTLKMLKGIPQARKVELRWRVSERIEYDSKGQVIRLYRPYFSDRHRYINDKSLRLSGLYDQQFHDPLGRLVRRINAEGNESRYTCHPWYCIVEDENDIPPQPPLEDGVPVTPGAPS